MWSFINKYMTYIFLIIVAIITSMALVVVWKVNTVQSNADILSRQVTKIVTIATIKENIMMQASAMDGYIMTGKREYLSEFRNYTYLSNKMQLDLIGTIRDSRKPLARELNKAYSQFIQHCEKSVIPRILEDGKLPGETSQKVLEQKNRLISLATEIERLRQKDTLSVITTTIDSSRNAAGTTKAFTLLGVVLGIALSLTLGGRFINNHKTYRAILDTTTNIAVTINEKGNLTSLNRAAQNFFGVTEGKIVGKKYTDVLGPGKLIDLDLPLEKIINTGIGVCNIEKRYSTSDGWKCVLNVDCLPMESTPPSGVLMVARDISERKVLEEKLYAMTLRDGLTGLYNHSFLKRKLNEELLNAGANNYPVAFILMDIDNFKFYNDRFGHLAGDEFLKEFAHLLKKCVRDSDIAGRYGGDEFAVILPKAGSDTALILAERIRSNVEKHPFPNKNLMPKGKITVSVGISIFPKDSDNGEGIIKLADEAMYRCKRNSKNEVQLYFSALKDFQKEIRESERTLFNVVQTLLGIINAKDRDTYLHLEKVTQYAGMICEAMNLNETNVKDIKLAAFLHDVGKIEIPRNILHKVDPLTQEEWSIIKQHPRWGASMVRSMQHLDNIIPMILHHHERYDGKGYPYGLEGEQIPLGSRILAVADSFDAMTNSRPYRISKNYIEALEEIERNRGTQFDPEIADIFISNFFNYQDNHERRLSN